MFTRLCLIIILIEWEFRALVQWIRKEKVPFNLQLESKLKTNSLAMLGRIDVGDEMVSKKMY